MRGAAEFVNALGQNPPVLILAYAIVILIAVAFYYVVIHQGRALIGPGVGISKLEKKTLEKKPDDQQEAPPAQEAIIIQEDEQDQQQEAKLLDGNSIGLGIRIGGELFGEPLRIIASEWYQYRPNNKVRSGWLFSPSHSSSSHAVAFFKIHVFEKGTGYIHLLDAANPKHVLWVETHVNPRHDEAFCWDCSQETPRTAIWNFRWKP